MTARQKRRFVEALASIPVVLAGCRYAGVTRRQAYAARADDAEFSEQWDEAIEEAVDRLELEALERATSDNQILTRLLQASRPEKFTPLSTSKAFDRISKILDGAGLGTYRP